MYHVPDINIQGADKNVHAIIVVAMMLDAILYLVAKT